jgi:FkbM family methyltransferase
MINSLKRIAKTYIAPHYRFRKYYYSQHGEDVLLGSFFSLNERGLYVDIGAHHPFRFSNTFLFYKLGWRGINIDAKPGSKALFDRHRPRDINLEVGIAKSVGELRYYMFKESALNTFSVAEAKRLKGRGHKIEDSIIVETKPLRDILALHLEDKQEIDFFSIDVEGFDLQVLESNDWKRYVPKFVLAEENRKSSVDEILLDNPIYEYLHSLGYRLIAKTYNTLVFRYS